MRLDRDIRKAMKDETQKFKIPSDIRKKVFNKVGISDDKRQALTSKNILNSSVTGYIMTAFVALIIGGVISTMIFIPSIKNNLYLQDLTQDPTNDTNKIESVHSSEYIELQLLSTHSGNSMENDITKLYPEYIPLDMKLVCRWKTEDNKGIVMDFSGNSSNNYMRFIHITIIPKQMIDNDSYIGEKSLLSNDQGLLETIYYPDGKTLEMGSIVYEINDTIILAKASGVSKEELISTISSIKNTEEELPDHTDDSQLMETVSKKIFGEDYATQGPPKLDEAIIKIKELHLEYEIVSVNGTGEYDGSLIGFTVREGVVFLFVSDSKSLNSPKEH